MRRSVRADVRQLIRLQFRAPFWSRIPGLGLLRYPRELSDCLFFWFSAAAYSLIYFFCIALVVVVFTHSLYGWSGFESYMITTLHDVMYKNLGLVGVFVGLEAWMIYQQAILKAKVAEQARKTSVYKVFLHPALLVAGMYAVLKILTRNFMMEPNLVPVIASFYVFFVCVTYAAD